MSVPTTILSQTQSEFQVGTLTHFIILYYLYLEILEISFCFISSAPLLPSPLPHEDFWSWQSLCLYWKMSSRGNMNEYRHTHMYVSPLQGFSQTQLRHARPTKPCGAARCAGRKTRHRHDERRNDARDARAEMLSREPRTRRYSAFLPNDRTPHPLRHCVCFGSSPKKSLTSQEFNM